MSKISTIEQFETLFMPTKFEIVKKENHDIDDIDALSHTWKMLRSTNSIYDNAIKDGKPKSEALSKTFDMFSNSYQSIAS